MRFDQRNHEVSGSLSRLALSWQELTEIPLDQREKSSLAPLTQMAVELSKTPAEALSRMMAKEFLRRKGGGEFFCEGDR